MRERGGREKYQKNIVFQALENEYGGEEREKYARIFHFVLLVTLELLYGENRSRIVSCVCLERVKSRAIQPSVSVESTF